MPKYFSPDWYLLLQIISECIHAETHMHVQWVPINLIHKWAGHPKTPLYMRLCYNFIFQHPGLSIMSYDVLVLNVSY